MARITLPEGADPKHLLAVGIMVRSLMVKHGLGSWTLQWDRATKRAGYCDRFERVISLSAPLMSIWTMEQARDTALHEIAHGLTPGHGHDYFWENKCREIGAKPSRYYSTAERAQVPLKWEGTCPKGHKSYAARKSSTMGRSSCPKCCPRFNPDYIITWRDTKEASR